LPSQYIGSISAGSAITEVTPGQVTAAIIPVGELDANVGFYVIALAAAICPWKPSEVAVARYRSATSR
jgi:hypothetical protein